MEKKARLAIQLQLQATIYTVSSHIPIDAVAHAHAHVHRAIIFLNFSGTVESRIVGTRHLEVARSTLKTLFFF